MAAAVIEHDALEATGVKSDCHSRVMFHIEARGLKKLDMLSSSDPFAVLFLNGVEINRTEVIMNTENPSWTTGIELDYFFEEVQNITIRLFDEDSQHSPDLSKHDNLGEVNFQLGSLMSAPGERLSMAVHLNGRADGSAGTVTASASELAYSSEWMNFQLRGKKLLNKDGIFGTSDPFFILHRAREDGSYVPVYKSVVIDNSLNPNWPRDKVSLSSLTNGDYDCPLKIEVWDFNSNGRHDFMGSAETSVRAILDKTDIALTEKKKNRVKQAGTIHVQSADVYKEPSFLEYIKGGVSLNLIVGIDYTGSNGNPAQPGTLHYIDPHGVLNPYQATISNLSTVLEQYDSDKLVPCYGFGARGGPENKVSHLFPINDDPTNPYLQGQEAVLQAYRSSLTKWGLSGPTIFAQLINQAVAMATRKAETDYTVLLIITDGQNNDVQATRDAIVAASQAPMSIIIIGVGDADFSGMTQLDGDDGQRVVNSHGQAAVRDCVQFVPFNQYASAAPGRMAKETLQELPGQLVTYMKSQNRLPQEVLAAEIAH